MGFKNTKFQSTVQLRMTPTTYDIDHGEEVWVDTQGRILVKLTPDDISLSGKFEYQVKDEKGTRLGKGVAESREEVEQKIKSECAIPVVFDQEEPAKRDNELFV